MTITITLIPGLLFFLGALFFFFAFVKFKPSANPTDWSTLAWCVGFLGVAIWLGFG